MKCPECGSNMLKTWTLVHGYAFVDLQTGELDELPDECDYDVENFDEFFCRNCSHEWQGKYIWEEA
jgi:hypothetical protein